jgi:phosphatidylglycerophosphate synthase
LEVKVKDLKSKGKKLLEPLVNILVKLHIHPHILSITGLLLSVAVGFLFAKGFFFEAGLLLLFAGLFDVLDGEVARKSGLGSSFGALLDSTLDRFSEFFVFGGLLYYYHNSIASFILLYLALFSSLMVSYLRARGEGLGASVRAGPMDRTGRHFFLVFASLIGKRFFILLMVVFLILTVATVVKRWSELYNKFQNRNFIV